MPQRNIANSDFPSQLTQLASDEFAVSVAGLSTPTALLRLLRRHPDVTALWQAIQEGAIQEDTFCRFISWLSVDSCVGVHFIHDVTLAALVVACDGCRPTFTDDFIRRLANVRLAEIPLAPRVARECIRQLASRVPSSGGNMVSSGTLSSGYMNCSM